MVADRHFGVGADGLILLLPSEVAHCRMVMWNADGSRGSMCGNGIRCLALLAYEHGRVSTTTMDVETDSGTRRVRLLETDGRIAGASVDMGEVTAESRATTAVISGEPWQYHRADAGNPHAVIFSRGRSGDSAWWRTSGPRSKRSPSFPRV